MPRIPLIDIDGTTGALRDSFDRLPVKANIFRLMAHAESCMPALMRLGGAILGKQLLGHRERELLILQVAWLEQGRYEWEQHVPIARTIGISDEQIEALRRQEFTSPSFDARDRSLLAFGAQITRDVRVDSPVFAEMKVHFSDREIVESIVTIGYYMMLARLTEATETEIDGTLGTEVFAAVQRLKS